MGSTCTKNGVYIKDKESQYSDGKRVFVDGSRDESVIPEIIDAAETINKVKGCRTILTDGVSSEIIDGDIYINRMQKIKKMKTKVKTKSDRKANSMFAGEKNDEITVPEIELRRHTDKTGLIKRDSYKLISALEPVDEEIDYTKNPEYTQGSAGACCSALNNVTGKVIIVKTLDLTELSNDSVQDRVEFLEKNLEIVKDIRHDNIINYLAVSENDKNIDILMEYVPGGSLKFLLGNFEKFKEKLVRSYVKQILEGLKALHERSIIHGDLKCSNLLIDDLGIIKLSDFSFIKQVLNNTKKMDKICRILKNEEDKKDVFTEENLPRIGSECYTPPEVVKESNYELNQAFDIWGVGCVILEMLTGVEPWNEYCGDIRAIIKNLKTTKHPPTLPTNISDNCRDFLENCFKLDPCERPTVDTLLDHPFLTMTEKEIKESLEASNFISFFSILASHKSFNENEQEDIMLGDKSGKISPNFYSKKYMQEDINTSLPNIEIRVSKIILSKLRSSNVFNSIVSNGSIQLQNLSTEHLIDLNKSFKIEEFTCSNLTNSMENIHSSVTRLSNNASLQSHNKLAIILKNLQDHNLIE